MRDSKIKSYREGTHQFLGPNGKGLDLIGSGESRLLAPPENKRSFWDKLFGKKILDPAGQRAVNATASDSRILPANRSSAKKDSVMRRLIAEMATRRLEQEQAHQIKTSDPKDLPKAAVINPDAVKQTPPSKSAVETSPG